MDFSLTTLFVVPTNGALATGDSGTMTQNKIGVFLDGGKTLGTTSNVVGKKIQVMQGRSLEDMKRLGSKKSGVFSKDSMLEWYKVLPTTGNQTTKIELTSFKFKCGEDYAFTMKFSSFYLGASYYDGLVESVFFNAPCCDCDATPCEYLTDGETLTLLTALVADANAKWGALATFVLTGTTAATFKITITSMPLTAYQNTCAMFQPAILDEMLMFPYLYIGPKNSQTPLTESLKCREGMEVTVTQRATYSSGTANDVKIMEYHFNSYQSDFKKMSMNQEWNQHFTSQVDGTAYTMYYIKFKNISDSNATWASYVHTDQAIIIAVPSEANVFEPTLIDILEANLGDL